MIHKLESFICRSKYDYATFVVLQRFNPEKDGGYYMLAIESSYGNGFAYAWSHPGSSFYRFLTQCDEYYLADKLCQGESQEVDWEKTGERVRKTICERRRQGFCSAIEARDAWPESLFDNEVEFWDWSREQDVVSDVHEEIVLVPGRRARDFFAMYKMFWADFSAQLLAADRAQAAEAIR